MPDYSAAAENTISEGLVEEYQYRNLRVRRGTLKEQMAATAMAEGLAARRAAGGFARLGKFQEARR